MCLGKASAVRFAVVVRSGLALIVAIAGFVLLTGCASSLTRGVRSYNAGDHTGAIIRFVEMEDSVSGGRSRARYALYRGLTHLSLGDAVLAERWLAEAKQYLDADRKVFESEDRCRLLAAWAVVGHHPGTLGREVLERR